ncbi:MAG TPA: ABC transporter substrate-binding protein [Xanthobacteraceae bacterium]|nr:ABC transporter substrate-binding protein [Xanthobacteraceae bacterium]
MKRRDFITALFGTAVAVDLLPLAAQAQHKPMAVIGYLHFANADYVPGAKEFLQGLQEKGYADGKDVVLEFRWAEGHYDRLPALAAELVARKVDLIVAFGPPSAHAAKMATSTIPIVFEVGNDAVEAGLVASLSRPGGNATGFNVLFTQVIPKLVDLLSQLIPSTKRIALLVNPNSPTAAPSIQGAQEGARSRNVQLAIVKAANESDIDTAFASIGNLQGDGIVVSPDPFFDTRRAQLVDAAARYKIPAIYFERGFCTVGGLISYGSDLAAVYRQMGVYAGRILSAEKPADLPVVQPTKYDLVVNLKTAKTLGIDVPQSLLVTADEVIE